jgi:flagellar biosynthetic protein FlhB
MDDESPDDVGDRTEEPTERKRQELRRKGQVARSQDLITASHLLALAIGLWVLGTPAIESLGQFLRSRLERAPRTNFDAGFLTDEFRAVLEWCAMHMLPLMLLAAGAGVVVGMGQVGFLWLPELLEVKWSNLNPVSGLQRIFSMQGWMKLAGSLAKLLGMGLLAAWFISREIPQFLPTTDADVGLFMLLMMKSMVRLALLLAIVLFALALGDFGWQWWSFERQIKMTRQEVVDEYKDSEGDPKIRGHFREQRQKLLKAQELDKVKTANVVITNPTEIAIALKYDPKTMMAPAVVAKGKGDLAGIIRRIAAENGIPIIERRPLAQALYKMVRVGETIPVEMYEVFVEIMKYVYSVTGKTPQELIKRNGQ